jgi:hypothetical protein
VDEGKKGKLEVRTRREKRNYLLSFFGLVFKTVSIVESPL